MPQETIHPLRGPLCTAIHAGVIAAVGVNFFSKENLSGTQLSHLFLAGLFGGLIMGNLLPFLKKDNQAQGWDPIDMREVKLAVNPILYAASNMGNRMTEVAMLMTSLALGNALLHYGPESISTPLTDLLWKDAASAGILFALDDTLLLLINFEKHFDIKLTDSIKRFLIDCTPCCQSRETGMESIRHALLMGHDTTININIESGELTPP